MGPREVRGTVRRLRRRPARPAAGGAAVPRWRAVLKGGPRVGPSSKASLPPAAGMERQKGRTRPRHRCGAGEVCGWAPLAHGPGDLSAYRPISVQVHGFRPPGRPQQRPRRPVEQLLPGLPPRRLLGFLAPPPVILESSVPAPAHPG